MEKIEKRQGAKIEKSEAKKCIPTLRQTLWSIQIFFSCISLGFIMLLNTVVDFILLKTELKYLSSFKS